MLISLLASLVSSLRGQDQVVLIEIGAIATMFVVYKFLDGRKTKSTHHVASTALAFQAMQSQIDRLSGDLEHLRGEIKAQRLKTHLWSGYANKKMLEVLVYVEEVNQLHKELGRPEKYDLQKMITNEGLELRKVFADIEKGLHHYVTPA